MFISVFTDFSKSPNPFDTSPLGTSILSKFSVEEVSELASINSLSSYSIMTDALRHIFVTIVLLCPWSILSFVFCVLISLVALSILGKPHSFIQSLRVNALFAANVLFFFSYPWYDAWPWNFIAVILYFSLFIMMSFIMLTFLWLINFSYICSSAFVSNAANISAKLTSLTFSSFESIPNAEAMLSYSRTWRYPAFELRPNEPVSI